MLGRPFDGEAVSTVEDWLSELSAKHLVLGLDSSVEAQNNLWYGSVPLVERQVTASEVVGFLHEAVALLRAKVQRLGVPDAQIYAWHDEMAGQLRISVARCQRNALPFGCEVVVLDDPNVVAESFCRHPNGTIPWQELVSDADVDVSQPAERMRLAVWAVASRGGPTSG